MHTRGIFQVSPTGVANILHRSAADWLEKSSIWNDICSKTPKDFDSNLTLLEVGVVRLGDKVRVRLGRGRTLRSDFWGTVTDYLWRGFFVRDTPRNQKKLVEMLDEFDKVATRVVNEIYLLRNTWESKEWVPTDFDRLVGGPHYSPDHWVVTQGSTSVREGVVSENCFIGLAAQMGMLPYVKAKVSQNPDLAMSSPTRTSLLANATFGFHYHSLRRAVSRYVIQVPTFRQRLRTVKYLLHHGADPRGPIWPEDPKFTVSDQVLLLVGPSDNEEEKEKVEKEKSKEEELEEELKKEKARYYQEVARLFKLRLSWGAWILHFLPTRIEAFTI
ncbi:hypothetical protein BKA64DRAFT_728200 [Cadophora sp. MPI-SDFR-AT-0126]|nr:hypothetical protein BKA64DRAFT_728200 [Leotiomycetes sp. MPI-SDFR-AT-0126]